MSDRIIQPPFWTPPPPDRRWPSAAQRWRRRRRALREAGEASPSAVRVPPPWPVFRLAARVGDARRGRPARVARRLGAALDWLAGRPADLLRRSPTLRLAAELGALGAVIAGMAGLWIELDKREEDRAQQEEDRINAAWALVAAAKSVGGNSGLGPALETLHARRIDLIRLQAAGAYLHGVRLPKALLYEADLSNAALVNADFSKAFLLDAKLSGAVLLHANFSEAVLARAALARADLSGAVLSGAVLAGADLSEAHLAKADLSHADLSGTTLTGADLRDTILAGADLSGADLTGAQVAGADLTGACGDGGTRLPDGLAVPPCPAR